MYVCVVYWLILYVWFMNAVHTFIRRGTLIILGSLPINMNMNMKIKWMLKTSLYVQDKLLQLVACFRKKYANTRTDMLF